MPEEAGLWDYSTMARASPVGMLKCVQSCKWPGTGHSTRTELD